MKSAVTILCAIFTTLLVASNGNTLLRHGLNKMRKTDDTDMETKLKEILNDPQTYVTERSSNSFFCF